MKGCLEDGIRGTATLTEELDEYVHSLLRGEGFDVRRVLESGREMRVLKWRGGDVLDGEEREVVELLKEGLQRKRRK